MEPSIQVGSTVKSVCCYCGTGCGVLVTPQGDGSVRVEGDPSHPANWGRLCSKGRTLGETTNRPSARLLQPQWRAHKQVRYRTVAWDDALETLSARLAQAISLHGADSVAFYLSGQLLTEDYYVFNKLARALVGTNNIDSNSRLCMSSAVAGYKRSLGADAPPPCYEDIEQADCVFIVGANMAYAHPVLFRRLEAAKAARPDMKIIVADPRRTDTASLADLYLPLLPGTDVALFQAMLQVMMTENWINEDYITQHTEGFTARRAEIQDFSPQVASALCGVSTEAIVTAARWFANSRATLSCYTMGLNQYTNGSDKNAALIQLHLATGQIGRVGTGPFSLTGQPNAMGGREVGAMANLLSGHRDPADAQHRAEMAALWKVPSLPAAPGLTAIPLFEAAAAGKIKVLWIACTNPAHSMPDQALVRAALEKVDFVVVQESFVGNETLQYADLILPATTWPEKNGTVTNSERRISRVRAALPAPGQARADWAIAAAVGRRLARRLAPACEQQFAFSNEAAIFAEHAATTAGRDLDYSRLTYAQLEVAPQQWPFDGQQGQVRLYTHGDFPTTSGKAQFVSITWRAPHDDVNAEFPLRLVTGRLRDHWHTTSRTALVPTLTRHVEEPCLSLHSTDLAAYGLSPRQLVQVRSARGRVYVPVDIDDSLQPGVAFLPMHWGESALGNRGINVLTTRAIDPFSRQPELKFAAIAVQAAALPWTVTVLVCTDVQVNRPLLAPWRALFPYVLAVPVNVNGVEHLRVRLARETPLSLDELEDLSTWVATLLSCASVYSVARCDDLSRGLLRRVWLNTHTQQPHAFLLTGDAAAEAGLMTWFNGQAPTAMAALLLGRDGGVPLARVVCACEGVREDVIQAAIAQGADVEQLKQTLRCGTGCGSCVPELKRLCGL